MATDRGFPGQPGHVVGYRESRRYISRHRGLGLAEIQTLRWEHARDDCIELPNTKTGERAVPLGPRGAGGSTAEGRHPQVIAGRLPGAHLTDLQHPWRRIRERADQPLVDP